MSKINNKSRYLIQCANCGALLFKTEQGLMFGTKIKCSNCKNVLEVPKDVVVTKEERVIKVKK